MNLFSRKQTVTGAAHTSYSMFGARGPCLSPEDETGAGAAPAAPPGVEPTAAPAPIPPTGDVAFTAEQQAVINKLIGHARQEGRNAATRTPIQAPVVAAPVAHQEPKLTLEDVARELAETKMRSRFDKQALRRGFSDDAADDLFDLYKAHKPTDDEQWFSEREKRLVLKQASAPPPTATATAAASASIPSTAPISNHGSAAPNGATGWRFEMNNPIGMSPASRAQMDAELGADVARKQRLAAAQGQAQTMRVVIKP